MGLHLQLVLIIRRDHPSAHMCMQAQCVSAETLALQDIANLHDSIPVRNAIDVPTLSVEPGLAEAPEVVVCFTEPCEPLAPSPAEDASDADEASGTSDYGYVVLAQAPEQDSREVAGSGAAPPPAFAPRSAVDAGASAEVETASAASCVARSAAVAAATTVISVLFVG